MARKVSPEEFSLAKEAFLKGVQHNPNFIRDFKVKHDAMQAHAKKYADGGVVSAEDAEDTSIPDNASMDNGTPPKGNGKLSLDEPYTGAPSIQGLDPSAAPTKFLGQILTKLGIGDQAKTEDQGIDSISSPIDYVAPAALAKLAPGLAGGASKVAQAAEELPWEGLMSGSSEDQNAVTPSRAQALQQLLSQSGQSTAQAGQPVQTTSNSMVTDNQNPNQGEDEDEDNPFGNISKQLS